jgi:hypothetical protein
VLAIQSVSQEFVGDNDDPDMFQIGYVYMVKKTSVDGKLGQFYICCRKTWDYRVSYLDQTLPREFYDGSSCYIIVYDATNPSSFLNVKMWHSMCCSHLELSTHEDFPFILIANKSDLPGKSVQTAEA